jgi:hypothetical protein
MKIKDNKRLYNLLSDVLKISGQYNNNDIENAKYFINKTSNGEYHDIMLAIFNNFNRLSNIDTDNSVKNQKLKEINAEDNSKNIVSSNTDLNLKELMAMLEDTEFITSKKDIVNIIHSYFKDRIICRSDNRDKIKSLIKKMIDAYKKMDDIQQKKIYSSIRRLYLKNRKSNLSGWTDIITGGERYNETSLIP